ncbi:hypothetical protein HMPREF1391_00051 [Helicobacter pylori GAM100Ai]|uniref:Uncharacterized protein n=1 Tax=Helicobacter pylori GAM100Ai TaxID=1159019 RepID=A0AB72ZYJ2_HELPX|nr:hypothetical protein HMPREF1391_00051 [Helicobacter pylori GAM100Ai]
MGNLALIQAIVFKKRFFRGGFSGLKRGIVIPKYFLYSQENKTKLNKMSFIIK